MKLKFLILLLTISTGQLLSQKETVYSIVKQPQSVDWYQKQLQLWKAELKTNPKNATAWKNAYIAMRMIKIKSSFKKQEDLDQFISQMQQAIPNTYEYHYLTYYNGNNNDSLFHHVKKAFEMAPNREEVYPDLLTHYILNQDKKKIKETSELWFNSNSYSANILNFGYNLLASCEDNSVLITAGDNDTYAPVIIQNQLNYKTDVRVLNIYLLQMDDYRKRLFNELGVPSLNKKLSDYKTQYDFMKAIVRQLEKHLDIPLYYSTTVDKGVYKESLGNTFVVGLVLMHCENKIDNIAILKRTIEQELKLDYITCSFSNDLSKQVVIQSNSAYLLGFLTLYNHYKLSGETTKKDRMEKLIRKIASDNNDTHNILKYLEH